MDFMEEIAVTGPSQPQPIQQTRADQSVLQRNIAPRGGFSGQGRDQNSFEAAEYRAKVNAVRQEQAPVRGAIAAMSDDEVTNLLRGMTDEAERTWGDIAQVRGGPRDVREVRKQCTAWLKICKENGVSKGAWALMGYQWLNNTTNKFASLISDVAVARAHELGAFDRTQGNNNLKHFLKIPEVRYKVIELNGWKGRKVTFADQFEFLGHKNLIIMAIAWAMFVAKNPIGNQTPRNPSVENLFQLFSELREMNVSHCTERARARFAEAVVRSKQTWDNSVPLPASVVNYVRDTWVGDDRAQAFNQADALMEEKSARAREKAELIARFAKSMAEANPDEGETLSQEEGKLVDDSSIVALDLPRVDDSNANATGSEGQNRLNRSIFNLNRFNNQQRQFQQPVPMRFSGGPQPRQTPSFLSQNFLQPLQQRQVSELSSSSSSSAKKPQQQPQKQQQVSEQEIFQRGLARLSKAELIQLSQMADK